MTELQQKIEKMRAGLNNPNITGPAREALQAALGKAEAELKAMQPAPPSNYYSYVQEEIKRQKEASAARQKEPPTIGIYRVVPPSAPSPAPKPETKKSKDDTPSSKAELLRFLKPGMKLYLIEKDGVETHQEAIIKEVMTDGFKFEIDGEMKKNTSAATYFEFYTDAFALFNRDGKRVRVYTYKPKEGVPIKAPPAQKTSSGIIKTPYFSYEIAGGKVALKTEYNPDVVTASRNLGGKWDSYAKVWKFDERDLPRVKAFLKDIFGTDGDETPDTVDVVVFMDKLPSKAYRDGYGHSVWGLGRQLAHRKYNDRSVDLGDGVTILKGGFPRTGGSRKNPRLYEESGTVLLVRDVPRTVFEKDELNCEGCYGLHGVEPEAVGLPPAQSHHSPIIQDFLEMGQPTKEDVLARPVTKGTLDYLQENLDMKSMPNDEKLFWHELKQMIDGQLRKPAADRMPMQDIVEYAENPDKFLREKRNIPGLIGVEREYLETEPTEAPAGTIDQLAKKEEERIAAMLPHLAAENARQGEMLKASLDRRRLAEIELKLLTKRLPKLTGEQARLAGIQIKLLTKFLSK